MHLDSIYKNRYQEYHLTTGEIADSRSTNWRQVEWEKVIQIDTFIRNQKFSVLCNNSTFKFFLNFRWAGRDVYELNKHREIKIWTVGWSDGNLCYLEDYDFKVGVKIKDYVLLLSEIKGHIHPRIINLGII